MMLPLVRELVGKDARIRLPVSVTCRVLKLCRAHYYRWLAASVTEAELAWAYRADALFDAHRDDPEFGCRYLLEEAKDAGKDMSARTAWRICSTSAWWSAFSKKRSARPRPGPPVHDDRLAVEDEAGRTRHNFTSAEAPNRVWLTDIMEHWTGDGSCTCARSRTPSPGGSWGYSFDEPMTSKLAVPALNSGVARRAADGVDVAGCIDWLNLPNSARGDTSTV